MSYYDELEDEEEQYDGRQATHASVYSVKLLQCNPWFLPPPATDTTNGPAFRREEFKCEYSIFTLDSQPIQNQSSAQT